MTEQFTPDPDALRLASESLEREAEERIRVVVESIR